MSSRPEIVCICGSARFMTEMGVANRDLTMSGVIVLAPCGADESPTPEQKDALDTLHMRKIDLADRVLIVNPGGYIGESTRREIDYARALGKPITFTNSLWRQEDAQHLWFEPVGAGSSQDEGEDPGIRQVLLRPHEFAGPFWDDEGHLSDDYEELRRWIGISRRLFNDAMAWNADFAATVTSPRDPQWLAQHRATQQALVVRLRQEVRPGIGVPDASD